MLYSVTNKKFNFYHTIKNKHALLSKICFLHTQDCIWCTHLYTAISKLVPCREPNMITVSHSDSKDTAVPESWLSSTKKITRWAALRVSSALARSSKLHASFLQQQEHFSNSNLHHTVTAKYSNPTTALREFFHNCSENPTLSFAGTRSSNLTARHCSHS